MFLIILSISEKGLIEPMVTGILSCFLFSFILFFINFIRRKIIKSKGKKEIEDFIYNIDLNILKDLGIDYSDLFDELEKKCNPSNFLNPYDASKVKVSNSIYSKLKYSKGNILQLRELRNQAIIDLNVKFSTEKIYDKLSEIVDPSKYINENYDAEKLEIANNLYNQIQKNKDNITKLENIIINNQNEISKLIILENKIQELSNIENKRDIDYPAIYFLVSFVLLLILIFLFGFLYSKEQSKNVNNVYTEHNITQKDDSTSKYKDIFKDFFEKSSFPDKYLNNYNSEKFSISYPESWIVTLENQKIGDTNVALQIMENQVDEDKYADNISIIVSSERRKESTLELAKMTEKNTKRFFSNILQLGIEDCTLSGFKGNILKHIIKDDEIEILQHQYIIKNNDNIVYIITLSMDHNNSKEIVSFSSGELKSDKSVVLHQHLEEILSTLVIK